MGSIDNILHFVATEDGGATILGRLQIHSGALATQAAVTSITCQVFDLHGDTPTVALSSPAAVVSAVIFDTLQTDARWTLDQTGFNFAHALPHTSFPNGDGPGSTPLDPVPRLYQVQYTLVPATGANITQRCKGTVWPMLGG